MGAGLPEWAGFFKSTAQLERFEKLIERDFKGRGMRVAIEDGRVIPVKPSGPERWGLSNLGQSCAAAQPAEWAGLIARHFDAILAVQRDEELSLAEAAERVMIRLWDERDLPPNVPWVGRDDIPGIRTVLCIDAEKSIRSVKREELDAWGVEAAELFMQALVNLRERIHPQVESLEPECPVRVISSEDGFYGGSLTVELERFSKHFGRYGAIVSIPTRAAVLLAPFNDTGVIQSIQEMIAMTAGLYRDGPGSVSPRVYWYYRKRWREIPYDMGDRLEVNPPPELVEVLNRVAPA
jgi:hypothetical protein